MTDDRSYWEWELRVAKRNLYLHIFQGRVHRKYGQHVDLEKCFKCVTTTERLNYAESVCRENGWLDEQ